MYENDDFHPQSRYLRVQRNESATTVACGTFDATDKPTTKGGKRSIAANMDNTD
jgi:hypothetical protein